MHVQTLFDESFLRAQWHLAFEAFESSPESKALLARLNAWAQRDPLTERGSETAFIQRLFVETWGYTLQGVSHAAGGDHTCRPQFPVSGVGARGAPGIADLALGRFSDGTALIPQVLCEFKDIRSGLDQPQARKDSRRSPVEQGLEALWPPTPAFRVPVASSCA